MVKVTEGVFLYAQLSFFSFLFILQQKAEEIPKSDLEPWLKFVYELERDLARGFQMMAPLKKHSSQAQTVPFLVFSHRGEPGYKQNCLTKLLRLPCLFSTKAQLSFSSLTIPMEMVEQPKKKASRAIF